MAISKTFHIESEDALHGVAADLAPYLEKGAVIALEGDLGAGKTAFSRALIRYLCGDTTLDVPSPTFTLLQTYDTPKGEVWHFDLYRLKDPEEVFELGWEDALATANLVLVEWPARIGTLLPHDAIHVTLTPEGTNGRLIEVRG